MGSGGSSQPYKASPASDAQLEALGTLGGQILAEKQLDRYEEEARWLRKVIEKEKAEKEWLMSQFERAERELTARSEEAAQLLAQLNKIGSTSSMPSMPSMPTSTRPPPILPNVADALPLSIRPSPKEDTLSASQILSPTTGPSLKERRGKNLSVNTGNANAAPTPKPANNVTSTPKEVSPAQPEPPSIDTQKKTAPLRGRSETDPTARTTRSEEFLASLEQNKAAPGQMVEPSTAKPSLGSRTWLDEPMSPLLKRRIAAKGGVSADFEGGRRVKRAMLDAAVGGSGEGTPLSVTATKIVTLDSDVPQTPKREPGTARLRKQREDAMWGTITEEA